MTVDTDTGAPVSRLADVPWRAIGGVAAAVGLLLLVTSGEYGFHGNELYFKAAGDRLAFGYVDQGALTPLIARISSELFGSSPTALRIVPTLCGMATIVLVAMIAREFGADRRSQVAAAVLAAASTYLWAMAHLLLTSTIDLVAWLVVVWLVLRILRDGNEHWWLAVGAVSGVALHNKYLIAMLLMSIGVGLVLTGRRYYFRSPWLWAGVGVAVLVALPGLVWQATNGWPELTMADRIREVDGSLNRSVLLPSQLLVLSPILFPVAVVGFVRCWRDRKVGFARPVAVAYPVILVLSFALASKPFYPSPLQYAFLAAGAEPALRWATRSMGRRALATIATTVALILALVLGVPVVPERQVHVLGAAGQGEQIGWNRLVDDVKAVWVQVPPDERGSATLFFSDYPEASAIDQLGGELPEPYSGHNAYGDWGPPPDAQDGPVVVVVRKNPREDEPGLEAFRGCELRGRVDNGLHIDNQAQGDKIYLCSGTKAPWSELWPSLRHYY